MHLHLTLALLVFVGFIDSEVVDKSFRSCSQFFYKDTPPQGFPELRNKAICQLFENRFHFATLHSSQYRIPLYSAYKLDTFTCNPNQKNRRSRWFIEPQLSGPTFTKNMTTEGTLVQTFKRVQAINIDYPYTDFDRGHLNPNFYQCDDSRTATFTLTNAVPQDPCFNQQLWKRMEEMSHNTMKELCNFDGVKSEVVDKSFRSCSEFFYKDTPPQGFPELRNKAICQLFENRFHFATLHSSQYRIPLYSAYKLDNFACNPNQKNRRSRWFIEPQLSGPTFTKNMTTEGTLVQTFKRVQAINIDYPYTDFDRGHLNPNFYQCDDSRTATFTLTNAVPQDPCFNQQLWKRMEEMSHNTMKELCNFDGAKRYFITGAIPGDKRIPTRSEDIDQPREYNRVYVPSIMWTAACCDSSNAVKPEDKDKGFSFGYYGENIPDSFVIPYKVPNFNVLLSLRYGFDVNTFKLFQDDCYSQSENSKIAAAKLAVPVERKIAESLVRMSESSESTMPNSKRRLIRDVSVNLDSNKAVSLKNWKFAGADYGLIEKRSDIQSTRDLFASINKTLILKPVAFRQPNRRNGVMSVNSTRENVQENTVSVNPTERNSSLDTTGLVGITDEYFVVPSDEKSVTASGARCRQNENCGYNGQKYKWCYVDWGNSWDYCCHKNCGFEQNTNYAWCYTNDGTDWAYCSQRSSKVTISDKKCTDGHECGLHGQTHHWCYTDLNKNWDYCCQPRHVCAKHGETYKWCYVGRSNATNWKHCEY